MGSRFDLRRVRGRIGAGLTAVGLLSITTMLGSSVDASAMTGTTPAVGCWGDYCSGQDPHGTGCDADARTLASDYSYGTPYAVELRWSPTCKTEWARVSAHAWPGGDSLGVVQPSTGYSQGYSSRNSDYVWSRMIYSPTRCVYAWWQDQGWDYAQTSCV